MRYLFDLAGGFWLLYLKMKRASVNLQECNGVDEEANRARLKHQALLREYLQLQKEFVSKKRKFQTAEQKRDNLVAIVKFLRRKRRYLLNCQHTPAELGSDLVDLQNVDTERAMLEEERKHATSETAVRYEEALGGRGLGEQVVREASRTEKMPRKYFIDAKGLGKKKISWRDQLTVKA